MITLQFIYVLMGILFGAVAVLNLVDAGNPKRYTNALFWGVYAVTFLLGSKLPDLANGILFLVMVATASTGRVGQGRPDPGSAEERRASARRWGNKLFIPALVVPAVTLVGTLTLKSVTVGGRPLVEAGQVTLISLAIATLVALAVGMAMLRPPPLAPLREARRLLDTVGWAAVLPQSLAALGALFALAGVGQVVSTIATRYIPLDHPFAAVATYCLGMALFTMLMGNAFAAFPVMTAGIGLPLITQKFGGDPIIMSAIGMLAGFCGTLMTPMAANFNIVPAALLELPDEHGVIKAQIPTALPLLAANIALMYVFVYR